MKTFKNLKVGDVIYVYYLTFLSTDSPVFYKGINNNASTRIIKRVDDDYVYWLNTQGRERRAPRTNDCVLNCSDDYNDYVFCPISTYNFSSAIGEVRTNLQKEWNILVYNRMKLYSENICNKICKELNTKNSYTDTDIIKIEYIEREVEVEKYVPICDKYKNYDV